MSIVPLRKVSLYGAEPQKSAVIDDLQGLGCLHLIRLKDGSSASDVMSSSTTDTAAALKYLASCSRPRRQVRRTEAFDHPKVVRQTLSLQQREQDLRDERDELLGAIEDATPWGEFALPPEGRIGALRFWFRTVTLADWKHADVSSWTWQEVGRNGDHVYVVVLAAEEPEAFPGTLVQLDPRSLAGLRERLEEVDEQLDDLQHERSSLTRWRGLLAAARDESQDAAARDKAARDAFGESQVFALQGWVPEPAVKQVGEFAEQHGLALTVEEPREDESPPTLLHNPEALAGSEGLVTFYKTPIYGSWDPSLISSFSFAVFFAMILADAGYACVLGVITLYLWPRLGKTQSGCRTRNVLVLVVSAALLYGILCGSYFGVSPSADSLPGRLKIIDAQSQSLMMPLTILVGVVHLSLANVVVAWLRRGSVTALAPLGWIAVMAGSVLVGIATFSNAEFAKTEGTHWMVPLGGSLLVGGLIAVFLFSSERPFFTRSFKTHALRIADGLQGLTGVTGLFGDVLSYLRLFALGLSSAKLSETFNQLGSSAWDADGIGVILAIAIIILGHTLCLMLGVISAVVHGLRLNCMEFFKWSLPDEGHLFVPFAKKARQS